MVGATDAVGGGVSADSRLRSFIAMIELPTALRLLAASSAHARREASFVGRLRPGNCGFFQSCFPPGMSVEKIKAGVALTLKQMTDRGWEGDVCYIRPDGTAGQTVERHLASAKCDCILIGAGVRLPPQRLADFEAVINAVHRAAPAAAIANL